MTAAQEPRAGEVLTASPPADQPADHIGEVDLAELPTGWLIKDGDVWVWTGKKIATVAAVIVIVTVAAIIIVVKV